MRKYTDNELFFGPIIIFFKLAFLIPLNLAISLYNLVMVTKSKINIIRLDREIDAYDAKMEASYPKVADPDVLSAEIVILFQKAGFPTAEEFKEIATKRLIQLVKTLKRGMPPFDLLAAMLESAVRAYDVEYFTEPFTTTEFHITDPYERARAADYLEEYKRKIEKPQEALELFWDTLARAYTVIIKALPKDLFDGKDEKAFAQMPLLERLSDPKETIFEFLKPFHYPRVRDAELFNLFREDLKEIDERAGRPFDLLTYKGSNDYLVQLMFPGWFKEVFNVKVPFEIFPVTRLEHWHLIAPSGHGKSQTLQHVIMRDLMLDDPPAMVIIEPKGDMIQKIQNLAIWTDRLKGRLLVVDPEYAPALNLFAIGTGRQAAYTRTQRAQMEAATYKLFNYVFSAIASDLTGKQGSAFVFLTRLMLTIPGATLKTLLDFLRDKAKNVESSKYYEPIQGLDDIARGFFENEFFGNTQFNSTRQELARRINMVLGNTLFAEMFAAPQNRLDLFQAIQGRMIVAVNTSKSVLEDAHALLGRCIIAQVFRAGLERNMLGEEHRRPAWLIIDEAGSYFDESFDEIITLARSMGIGILFAHQFLSQLSQSLRSSVSTNTTIKMAGGNTTDAAALARDFQTTDDVIRSTRKTDRVQTELIAYIRNVTNDGPVKISIPFGTMEAEPKMTKDEHAEFLRINNERLSMPNANPATTTKPVLMTDPVDDPSTDIPKEEPRDW